MNRRVMVALTFCAIAGLLLAWMIFGGWSSTPAPAPAENNHDRLVLGDDAPQLEAAPQVNQPPVATENQAAHQHEPVQHPAILPDLPEAPDSFEPFTDEQIAVARASLTATRVRITLSGKVRFAPDGEPARDALVTARDAGPDEEFSGSYGLAAWALRRVVLANPTGSARAGADGRYEIVVDYDDYDCEAATAALGVVDPPPHFPKNLPAFELIAESGGLLSTPARVAPRRAKSGTAELSIVIPRGQDGRGKVLDAATGRPISGALVGSMSILRSGSDIRNLVYAANQSGEFTFVNAGDRIALRAWAPGYHRGYVELKPEDNDVVVRLSSLASSTMVLEGRVFGPETGLAPPHVFVAALRQRNSRVRGPIRPILVEPDGRFRIYTDNSPAFQFWATAPGYEPHTSEVFDLAPGTLRRLPEVALLSGKPFRLRVFDADERPLAGATVRWCKNTQYDETRNAPIAGVTDEKGELVLHLPAEGNYGLRVSHAGVQDLVSVVNELPESGVLEIHAATQPAVSVYVSFGRVQVQAANVWCIFKTSASGYDRLGVRALIHHKVHAMKDGWLHIEGLRAGTHLLLAASEDLSRFSAVKEITLEWGKAAEVNLELLPDRKAKVRVEAQGRAVPQAKVVVQLAPNAATRGDGPRITAEAETNQDGDAVFVALSPAEWMVSCTVTLDGRKWSGSARLILMNPEVEELLIKLVPEKS